MRDAFSGWNHRNQFALVAKAAVDFDVVETKANVVWFSGTFQPLPSRRLLLKPEGQRSWKWWTLWTATKLNLDDVVKDKCNKQYRVMSSDDWDAAGYYCYELLEQAI